MDKSEEEMEEDDTEWRNSFVESVPPSPAAAAASGPRLGKTSLPVTPAHRVIVHFDLDCFYAQVEMIRNPALREVPLGIQQKYIIVTCNYVAREQGVTKLMSVTDAKEKCPQLVLVKGEDLTHYRDMSYKVTELLMSYCPLVERLGFDENFVDITEMVERRLVETLESKNFTSFKGHVYSHSSAAVEAHDHPSLALGSHIAAELREAIHSKLGLTGCAGIATSKLLAKLVSGTFKPNQQTTLLPENVSDIIGCLSGLRKIPGVGHQTAKRLQALGLVSVKDLQLFPLNDLVREFGDPSAQRLKNLANGVDDLPVTPTGPPQSLSDEDSFKKMSSTKDVMEKIQELLSNLVERMHKDGRQPHTFRLTIRRYSATNKWFSRESRQSPIPNHTGQKITSGGNDDAVVQLVPLAMKLFHKMVDSRATFHLTLINVCFSNLQAKGAAANRKGAITSFFTQSTSPRKTQILPTQSQDNSSQSGDSPCMDHQFSTRSMITQPTSTTKSIRSLEAVLHGLKRKQCPVAAVDNTPLQEVSCSKARSDFDETDSRVTHRLPLNVDPEVFRLLPAEIQEELLSPANTKTLLSTSVSPVAVVDLPHTTVNKSPQSVTDSKSIKGIKKAANKLDPSDRSSTVNHTFPEGNNMEEEILSFPQSSDCQFPGNVDPKVFSELPVDVQRELMSEWKQQKPILKTASSKKPSRGLMAKDKKSAGKGSQANNLLKYFKPN